MNKRAQQRLIGVTILILVAVAALIWFSGFLDATATPATIAELSPDSELVGKTIEVTGQVVAGSWASGTNPFVFEIEDEDSEEKLKIVYGKTPPGSFGDGTSATVTGTLLEDGSIEADYLVTKCPSKYESATGALTVTDVSTRAVELEGVTVKVNGYVVAGSIGQPGDPVRFQVSDSKTGGTALDVAFGGGLPDEFVEGAKVVITGSTASDGTFQCSEVALEKSAQ